MAAGDRLAPRWQIGSGAGAGGESPRAGREAGGTQSLGVLSGADDDETLPGPPKGRGGGGEEGPAGQRSEGQGYAQGEQAGCTPAR